MPEETLPDQMAKPDGQGTPGCPGSAPEVLETPDSQESISQDQQRPTIAQHIKRVCEGALPEEVAQRLQVGARAHALREVLSGHRWRPLTQAA